MLFWRRARPSGRTARFLLICWLGLLGFFSLEAKSELPELDDKLKLVLALLSKPTEGLVRQIYQDGLLSFDFSEAEEKFLEKLNLNPYLLVDPIFLRSLLKGFHERLDAASVRWLQKSGIPHLFYPQGLYNVESISWLDEEDQPDLFPILAYFDEIFKMDPEPLVFVPIKAVNKKGQPSVYLYHPDERLLLSPLLAVPGSRQRNGNQVISIPTVKARVHVRGADKLLDYLLKEVFLSNAVLTADKALAKESPRAYEGAILHSLVHYHQQLGLLELEEEKKSDEETEAKTIAEGWKTFQSSKEFQKLLSRELPIYAGREVLAKRSLRRRYILANVSLSDVLSSKEEEQALGTEICFLSVVRGMTEPEILAHLLEPARLVSLTLEYHLPDLEDSFIQPIVASHIPRLLSRCQSPAGPKR